MGGTNELAKGDANFETAKIMQVEFHPNWGESYTNEPDYHSNVTIPALRKHKE